ncbi:putative protein [Arabidopsis thaliana]|uniref:Uncharacterized protein AT4g38760 n=1 Tax=Arabidopsis thaliana TaxID=3702 RepID=Q9T0I4_ARATH|nr:putative protein [Arabidopsis thaliana]CAB80539.1 putative protein [Arabidopsis thaliana]
MDVEKKTDMNLDEIQSYILVERSMEQEYGTTDSVAQELTQEFIDMSSFLHINQCFVVWVESCEAFLLTLLLSFYSNVILEDTASVLHTAPVPTKVYKAYSHTCIICSVYAPREESSIKEEAVKLISDGLERRQSSVLEDLLSSCFPKNMGILSGSYNFSKLAVSVEAQHSACRVQIQLLMILIETLDMENLLQMVHDGVPFRSGTCVFSIVDVQEMDATISSLNTSEVNEAGPLVLAWAVFLCLISSLPGKEESPFLMDIDHVSYVHQAFEAASLSYFLEILQSNLLNDFDGPISGHRSVVRTFISAFIASYEINLQLEDGTLELILDILSKVYQGEESLCCQFWDRKSFVDGPIRCLLFDLESEFPFRSAEFIRLLSSLSEGSWPAECVYNFLDKSVGVSTLFDITSDSPADDASQLVETSRPLHIPGLEGLVIPSNTRGRILRVISENTVLVRWEYSLSGIIVLIIRLANKLYIGNNREAFVTLELLRRMVTFNKAVCFSLLNISHFFYVQESYVNGKMESDVRVVDIICNSVRSLTFDSGGAAVMAMAIDILAKLLRW